MNSSLDALGIIIVEFCILAVVCLALLKHYASPIVTADVKMTIWLSWLLGFAGILLLPYDIGVVLLIDGREGTDSGPLQTTWKFIYWSTFMLAWLVLPLQHDYHISGHFDPIDKMKEAIRKNIYFYLSAGIAGGIYIVYILSTSTKNSTSVAQVIGFLMALGNTYGVLLLCFFMGNGLVGLPVRLWQKSNYEAELRRLFMAATAVEGSYQEARYDLEDCELEVRKLSSRLIGKLAGSIGGAELLKCVDVLCRTMEGFHFDYRSTSRSQTQRDGEGDQYSAEDYSESDEARGRLKMSLVKLNARLKRCQMMATVSHRRWQTVCCDAREMETALLARDAQSQQPMSITSFIPIPPLSSSTMAEWWPSSLLLLHSCYCLSPCSSWLQKALAVVCSILSCVILWSELVMASELQSPIGALLGAYDSGTAAAPDSESHFVFVQTLAFLSLAYMSICAYWSLFRVNLFGLEYTLQSPQLSPSGALIVNGEYFCRMQFSLGFNFLLLINANRLDRTSFRSLMSNMDIIPVFGTSFTVYVPIVMVIVSLVTLFNGYGYCLKLAGVDAEDSQSIATCCYGAAALLDPDDEDRLSTGKRLVKAEWRGLDMAGAGNTKIITISPMLAAMSKPTARVQLELPNRTQRLEPKSLYSDLSNTDHGEDDDERYEMERGVHRHSDSPSQGRSQSDRGAPGDKLSTERHRVESWGLDEEEEEYTGGRY